MSTSDSNSFDGRERTPVLEGGVLAALPRTRPQRTSPRRAAARVKASKPTTPKPPKETVTSTAEQKGSVAEQKGLPTKAAKTSAQASTQRARVGQTVGQIKAKPTPPAKVPASATSTKVKAKAATPGKPAQPLAPKQGYEPEEEVELGNTVNPPSGVELVESVADIVGELANSGLAAGGRILKDAFSLLRRP